MVHDITRKECHSNPVQGTAANINPNNRNNLRRAHKANTHLEKGQHFLCAMNCSSDGQMNLVSSVAN